MIVGLTGASGHLGRRMLAHLHADGHTVLPVGRTWDDALRVDALLHLAAPNWRDGMACVEFDSLNYRIAEWSQMTATRVVAAGSWWQDAGGEAATLAYTRMKRTQQDVMPSTVVLFSVYGDTAREGRGFIPQLVEHLSGGRSLAGASRKPREWLHVDDACRALIAALWAPSGVWEARTPDVYSPAELLRACGGAPVPDYPERPSCKPRHVHPVVPGWAPRTSVLAYIRQALAVAA